MRCPFLAGPAWSRGASEVRPREGTAQAVPTPQTAVPLLTRSREQLWRVRPQIHTKISFTAATKQKPPKAACLFKRDTFLQYTSDRNNVAFLLAAPLKRGKPIRLRRNTS